MDLPAGTLQLEIGPNLANRVFSSSAWSEWCTFQILTGKTLGEGVETGGRGSFLTAMGFTGVVGGFFLGSDSRFKIVVGTDGFGEEGG